MAKLRIIGEGTEFIDDWGINSTDVGGVRINGNSVERLGKGGKWFETYKSDKPIEKLIWCENGQIMAQTADGRLDSANAYLTCNPTKKPTPRDYEVPEKQAENKNQNNENKAKKKLFGPGWWWRLPLKGIWAVIKFIFWTMLFSAFTGGGNSGKKKK